MSANFRQRAICALFLLVLFPTLQLAQIAIEYEEVSEHRLLDRREMIHGHLSAGPGLQRITLRVTVDRSGNVDSALAIDGPEEFREKAVEIEKRQRFKPFERNGAAVQATFEDYVFVVPPEQWATPRVPFPPIQDWNTLRIKLTRTGCYGVCPAYSVELHGDGQVLFEGEGNVLIVGHHRGHISKDALTGLFAAFRDADYFSAKDEYVSMSTDLPTFTTSIEFDGHKKAVKNYEGYSVGIPDPVARLERKIDQAVGTDKWTKGTPETGPALLAEHWDFRSHSIQNRELFATVLDRGPKQLIQLFVREGAPALDPPEKGLSPLAVAAGRGDSALVKQLIGTQRDLSPALLACALLGAASGGDLSTMRLIISYGARVNGPPCDASHPVPVLLAAAGSGEPAVVHEILKYHPDVNARGPNGQTALSLFLERGLRRDHAPEIVTSLVVAGADVNVRGEYDEETPIFHICEFPQLVPVLVKAGADVNAQNHLGETPLSGCDEHDYLNALIAAGADISHRDRMGRTAADLAREIGDEETARFLDAAGKAQRRVQ